MCAGITRILAIKILDPCWPLSASGRMISLFCPQSPDPVTTRKIPDRGSYAKPLLSDLRYSWVTKAGYEKTVFYPPEIPLEKVMMAMAGLDSTPPWIDWTVLCPTSWRFNKFVYFQLQEK